MGEEGGLEVGLFFHSFLAFLKDFGGFQNYFEILKEFREYLIFTVQGGKER